MSSKRRLDQDPRMAEGRCREEALPEERRIGRLKASAVLEPSLR